MRREPHLNHIVPRVSTAAANDSGELDLWSVPPEKFVAARNAAIERARAAGDTATAAELKALRRPTPSAWLVNALVRTAPKEIEAVFRAGDALIAAQGRVLAGADPDEMHTAMRAVREAIARAMKHARALLAEHGRKPTTDLVRRVTATLRSASLDRHLRQTVLEGKLTRDPSVDEVEALTDVRVPKRVAARHAKKPEKKKPPSRRAEEQREAKKRAEREARERLRAEVEAAEAAAEEAARVVEQAKRALTIARERHARAKKRAR